MIASQNKSITFSIGMFKKEHATFNLDGHNMYLFLKLFQDFNILYVNKVFYEDPLWLMKFDKLLLTS